MNKIITDFALVIENCKEKVLSTVNQYFYLYKPEVVMYDFINLSLISFYVEKDYKVFWEVLQEAIIDNKLTVRLYSKDKVSTEDAEKLSLNKCQITPVNHYLFNITHMLNNIMSSPRVSFKDKQGMLDKCLMFDLHIPLKNNLKLLVTNTNNI